MFTEGSIWYEIGYFCRFVIITVLGMIAVSVVFVKLSGLLGIRQKTRVK